MMKYIDNIFQDEIRCGFLVTADRKKLWQVELEMLVEFDKVCKKHNLVYFANYGTLLGAIRHGGFIPWDDDLDVTMPRPDYNRLCQIAANEFQEPYFFQNIYTDDILMTISKLRRSDTAAIDDFSKLNYNQGIFLDIWPLDVASDGTPRSSRIDEIKKLLIGAAFQVPLVEALLNKNENLPLSKGFLHKFMAMPVRDRFREFEEFCSNHFWESAMVRCQFLPSQYKAIKREWFEKIHRMPFENIDIPVPHGYDKILVEQYGDWHKFVRGTQQHQIVLFSTDIPYRNILMSKDGAELDYRNRLYTPTMINKIGDLYFIVDCWHGRVIYSDEIDKPISKWKTLADDLAGPHTIASDGEFYLVDDSEKDAIRVFKRINGSFIEVQKVKVEGRPHYILYDDTASKFYVALSNTAAIAACIVDNGKVYVEYIATIVDTEKMPCYMRSMSIIDDYMYVSLFFNVGVTGLYKLEYKDTYWQVIDKMIISNDIAGMNYLCKINEYYYVTVYTDNEWMPRPNILRCKKITDLSEGKYERLNDVVGLKGTPYFINCFDGHYYLTEIHQFSGIKSFDVIDNQIANVKEIFGWSDILDSSIARKKSIIPEK